MDIPRLSSPLLFKRTSSSPIRSIIFRGSFATLLRALHTAPISLSRNLQAIFESEVSFLSDGWALACTHPRDTGRVSPFLSSDMLILKQIVETLGRSASRGAVRGRLVGYGSTNQVRRNWWRYKIKERVLLPAVKRSLQQALREIVAQDEVPNVEDRRMFEKARTKLEGAEVKLLADPLEKMLRYHPRIGSL